MAGLARKPDKTKEMSTFEQIRGNLRVTHLQQFQEIYDPEQRRKGIRIYDFTSGEVHFKELGPLRDEQDEKINAEAEKITSEGKKLSEKPDSDPQVVEAVRFVENMTAEIMEQKERLTISSVKVTGTKSSTHTRKKQIVRKKPRPNCSSDLSAHKSTPASRILRADMVEVKGIDTLELRMQQEDVLERAHLKILSQPDEKWKDVDQSAMTTTMLPELTNNVTGEKSSTHTRKEQVVLEKPRPKCSSDLSAHKSTPTRRFLRAGMVEVKDMETFEPLRMQQEDVLERAHLKIFSQPDEKWKDVDQSATTTTMLPGLTNNLASLRRVCHDVKKYIQQINKLVLEKIQDLPQEIREKMDSVLMSFKRLIAGMWKLLLYDVLLCELTSLLSSSQNENGTISSKKRRLKYGFQMASMMVLWLAHDVESNPGPPFDTRVCIEKLTRSLSETLRYHLPVKGSLWSKSVAEAAYAAGYSPEYKWSNPSGNSKDKLMTLIERATELGRVLTSIDGLPAEFSPFVNDLGNYAIQEQLVIHYKMKNLSSAVDFIHGISSLGDEHKQTIMQQMLRLKRISEVPCSSNKSMDMCSTTDFEQLADSTTSRPNVSCQKKTKRRKPKRDQRRNEQADHFDNLDKSQNSYELEPVAAVTLDQQMYPGSDGKNETSIVLDLDETLLVVSKVWEVTVQEDMTKSLSARNTDENQTFSVGTKESEQVGKTGDAMSILNAISDSNMTCNQSHDIEFDDILVSLEGTETQVQNVMDDDARITDMPRTATTSPGMTQLQKADENLNDQLTNPPAQSPVVSLSAESDQICQTHDTHTNKHMETENLNPLKYDTQIMELQNLIPGQNPSCRENSYWSAEGNANDSGVEDSSMNINPDITESDNGSDSTVQENKGKGRTITYLERYKDNLKQDRGKADELRIEDNDSIEHFVQGEQLAKTGSETESLQQTFSPLATGSNSGHEAVGDEVKSVDGARRKVAEDDTCQNEAEMLSSGEQFAAAETEPGVLQQTISPMTAVTNSYLDTDRDEMHREETVDDNTSVAHENEAEDLTFGTEQFASTEPVDTGKQRIEPIVAENLAKFKSSLLEQVDAIVEQAIKAIVGNNTPSEHVHVVKNGNEELLICVSSDVEHTEPRVRSSDSSRKRNLTDPENGPTSKKWRQ